MRIQGATEQPRVAVSAVIDATGADVEPYFAAHLDRFEKLKEQGGNDVALTATLYRSGTSPGWTRLRGELMQKSPAIARWTGLATGIGAAAALSGLGLVPAAATGVGLAGLGWLVGRGLEGSRLTQKGVALTWAGKMHSQVFPDPTWSGRRTYQITGDSSDLIDSPPTRVDRRCKKPEASELGRQLAENQARYPGARQVLYVGGHGQAYHQVGNMKVSQLCQGLGQGPKADILLLNACLMGNLGAMAQLKDQARVAVASEEVTRLLPATQMLAPTLDASVEPTAAALKVLEEVAREGSPSALAAYDLAQMDGLLEALDALGTALLTTLDQGDGRPVEALRGATPVGQPMVNLNLHMADLGSFLGELAKAGLHPEEVLAAQQALDRVVIGKVTHEEYQGLSGLSFQRTYGTDTDFISDVDHYADLDLPKGWTAFIRKASPGFIPPVIRSDPTVEYNWGMSGIR